MHTYRRVFLLCRKENSDWWAVWVGMWQTAWGCQSEERESECMQSVTTHWCAEPVFSEAMVCFLDSMACGLQGEEVTDIKTSPAKQGSCLCACMCMCMCRGVSDSRRLLLKRVGWWWVRKGYEFRAGRWESCENEWGWVSRWVSEWVGGWYCRIIFSLCLCSFSVHVCISVVLCLKKCQ